ncbi:MAG: glycosyltransferase family 117 protein [Bacteroidales bacterium]
MKIRMRKYRLINNITGWIVFLVAAVTYLMTIEPTASLWDCGEFIASAYKLEVGHPPGNPVFMVIARFFTLFAGGDVSKVAAMVNAMSALASAFTILFLFWTITHLARKILVKNEQDYTAGKITAIMSAGTIGAIAYTFSDSFWFSAVEGEVYALSSLFTAVVFWAILKWENCADEEHSERWIILIAFLMGLSIGVHLLNLLTIPAIVLVYYFRKYSFSWKGFIFSTGISFLILALLLYGLIPGIVTLATKFDLFFVNTLGLPVNSGMLILVVLTALFLILAIKSTLEPAGKRQRIFFAVSSFLLSGIWIISDSILLNLILLVSLFYFVWYTAGKDMKLLNGVLTAIAVILIGYSSTAIIVIRSSANPPLDENNPENPFNLLYFLNREQYGSRPLFKGAYFNAPVTGYKEGKPKYSVVGGKYKITSHETEREYDERFVTFFPRMWSDQSDHQQVYQEWSGMKGIPFQVTEPDGEKRVVRKPRFIENLRFMFSYQLDFMYFRYFMWNFSGRQNDTQSYGGAVNGNWITGLNFLDEPRVGTIKDMPEEMKNDPSRNVYYMLPFILGLIGLIYHFGKDNRDWWIIMLLFIMTGIAIVIYLNQYPNQPRERDYAYVGSFYFFAVWIGLGVLAFFEWLSRIMDGRLAASVSGIMCFAAIPFLMGIQNWNDHDRSGRYLARDVAFNYLNSCAPGAILFTNGDNDTFPLWYAQEVEGMRTDVRVCNLMLLNTDWYIDQMKYKTYESDPLPISLPSSKYYEGVNNQVFIVEKTKDPVNIKTIIEWVMSENEATKVRISATEKLDVIPSRTIRIPVDSAEVIASGTVKKEDADKIVPYIDITLKGSSIMKSQLIILDIVANNNWKRPIYFVTGYHNDAMGLEEYFQLEGIAYRLVPIKSHNKSWLDYGRIDTDILYENMMNKFVWNGAKEEDVYLDYNHKRTLIVIKARLNYARLAKALSEKGDNDRALKVLNHCMEMLPAEKVPYDMFMPDIIEAYYMAGDTIQASKMTKEMSEYYFKRIDYYFKQSAGIIASADYEIQSAIQFVSRAANAANSYSQKQLADELTERLNSYYNSYIRLLQPELKVQ